MAENAPVAPVSTFVVRFWQEWSDSGPRWRGRISHIQSSEGAIFMDLDEMVAFVRDLGVMAEDKAPSVGDASRDQDEP